MAIGDKKSAVMQSDMGIPGGVATLSGSGNVPAEQLAAGGNVGDVLTRLSSGTAWIPGGGGGVSGLVVAKSYLVTLTASAWTGSGPYTQTVTVTDAITATTAGLIGAAQSATKEQRFAARAAVLGISGQGTDTVTVIADGAKPVIDIPAEILIFAGDSDYYTKSTTNGLLALKQDIFTTDTFFSMLDEIAPPEMHRMIFRGKNLGTSLTSAQRAQISAGTFKDLWLGDYWIISGVIYRIVDFDYWYGQGDTAFNTHHLVVMPDRILYNAKMNDSNTTEGGYVGSKMYTENLETAKTTFATAFGDALLTHREYLVKAVSNGKASGGAWCDSKVDLPNEIMMYGHPHFVSGSDGSTVPAIYTTEKTQLALMQAVPRFINPYRENQWLRDVVSAAFFASVYNYGNPAYDPASVSFGVRPAGAVG